MTNRPPGSDPAPASPGDEVRPDVRWVRHRPSMRPLPRWGLVVALVLFAVVLGSRQFVNWVRDQTVPEGLPGDEVEFAIVEG